MHPIKLTPMRIATALLVSSLFATGCSSSSSSANPTDTQLPTGSTVATTDIVTVGANSGTVADEELLEDGAIASASPDSSVIESDTASAGQTATPAEQEPISDEPATSTPAVPDPMTPNTTTVMFDIQVPAYQSDALQVGVTWGDNESTASWVGDEFWSVTDEFLTNTENLLVVTFYDDNGAVTLGSFERAFRTGSNTSEVIQITASDFDTARWTVMATA